MKVKFNFCCQKVTDGPLGGDDEVYFIVAAKKSDGTQLKYRLPGDSQHWDMGRDDAQNNIQLAEFDLRPNETAKIVVLIMEEDGGTSQPYQEIAAKILAAIPSGGITQVIGGVLYLLNPFINFEDSDDYIGGFEINLTAEIDGSVRADWSPMENAREAEPVDTRGSGSHSYRFDGSGSDYFGWGILEGVRLAQPIHH